MKEGAIAKHCPKARNDLFLGLLELCRIEISREKLPRGWIEPVDLCLISGHAVLQDVVKSMNGCSRNGEQRAGHESKQGRSAAGHLRLEKRADNEVVHFQRAVHDF